jgi:hypothetical protein
MTPRCPRCGSSVLGPCSEWLPVYDEKVRATHECAKCCTQFKHTPGTRPATKETTPCAS